MRDLNEEGSPTARPREGSRRRRLSPGGRPLRMLWDAVGRFLYQNSSTRGSGAMALRCRSEKVAVRIPTCIDRTESFVLR